MATQTPTFDTSKLVAETERALLEGTYVAVGLGVLGFQRAQVRRRELARRFEGSDLSRLLDGLDPATLWSQLPDAPDVASNLASARAQLSDVAKSVDERVAPARRQIEEQVEALEERLPASAKDLVSQLRTAVEGPEARLRAAVGLD